MLSTDYRRIAEACTQALGIKHVTVQVCGVGSGMLVVRRAGFLCVRVCLVPLCSRSLYTKNNRVDGFTRRQQRREAKVKQETKQNLLSEEADQKTSAEPKQTRPAKKTNKSPPKDPVPSGQVSASASAAKKTPKKSKTTKPKEEKKAAQEPESQPSGGLPFRVERTLLKTLPVVVDEVNGIPITTISRCSGDLDVSCFETWF